MSLSVVDALCPKPSFLAGMNQQEKPSLKLSKIVVKYCPKDFSDFAVTSYVVG